MLSKEQLEALGLAYKSTGGVRTLMWKGHQFVFRHPTIDEWDSYTLGKSGAGSERQISQLLLVALDGETDILRARQLYGVFLASGNAGFPNAPIVNATLSALAGTVEEEDIAHMGKAGQLFSGTPPGTPAASPNGSATAPTVGS